MQTSSLNQALAATVLLFFQITPIAFAEDGDGDVRLEVFGTKGDGAITVEFLLPNGRVDERFVLGPDSLVPEPTQSRLLGQILIEGEGDPFLSYDISLTNDDDVDLEILFNVSIDIDPVRAGLPVTSTLSGEFVDPDGGGVDGVVFHRGFVESSIQPGLQFGFDTINESVTSTEPFAFQVDSVVPESLLENDLFRRLRVASSFTIPPGDAVHIRGNSTIVVPEPNAWLLLIAATLYTAIRFRFNEG